MTRNLWRMTNGIWRGVTPGALDVVDTPPPPVDPVAPTVVAVGTRVTGVGAVSPAWPTHQANDIGIMYIETAAQAIGILPSGWAHVAGSPFSIGTGGDVAATALTILWRRATTASEATLSIGDSGDHQQARIIVIRGAHTTGNPVFVLGTNDATGTSVSIPGGTTPSDSCLILAAVSSSLGSASDPVTAASWANTSFLAGSLAEQMNAAVTDGNGGGIGLVSGTKSDTGVVAATTATLTASATQMRVCLAVSPTVGTTPPPPTLVAPTIVGVGVTVAGVGSLTPAWPTGHVSGDVGIMLVETAAQAIGTLPSGWAHVAGSMFSVGAAGGVDSTGLTLLWKRATTNSMASLSIGDSGDHQSARIIVVRGAVATGTPVAVLGSDTDSTPALPVTIPGGATLSDRSLILAIVTSSRDSASDPVVPTSWANTSLVPASLVQQTNYGTSVGNGGGIAVLSGTKETTGTVVSTTATLTATGAQVRVTLAISPSVSGPPPPSTGSFRTMLGAWRLPLASWGTQPAPDLVMSDTGAGFVNVGANLDDAIAVGAHMFGKFYGNNSNVKNADGSFSTALWIAEFNAFVSSTAAGRSGAGVSFLRACVASGHFRGLVTLDDFVAGNNEGGNAFIRPITYEEIETICAHAKGVWDWMPLLARGPNVHLRARAVSGTGVRRYRYLDAGWSSSRPQYDLSGYGTPAARYAAEVQAGRDCGLGCVTGINIRRGTTSRTSPDCIEMPGGCAITAAELLLWGRAALATPGVCAFLVWSAFAEAAYWNDAGIQASMQTLFDESQGRNDAPLNIRGDLVDA